MIDWMDILLLGLWLGYPAPGSRPGLKDDGFGRDPLDSGCEYEGPGLCFGDEAGGGICLLITPVMGGGGGGGGSSGPKIQFYQHPSIYNSNVEVARSVPLV